MLGHAKLDTTQLYAQVSIQKLKAIHTATHPGAKMGRKGEEDVPAEQGQHGGVMATAMALKPAEYPHIVKTPGVCGGQARMDGTRISVKDVVLLHKWGMKLDEMRGVLQLVGVAASLVPAPPPRAGVDGAPV
jgi:hypothetical protein